MEIDMHFKHLALKSAAMFCKCCEVLTGTAETGKRHTTGMSFFNNKLHFALGANTSVTYLFTLVFDKNDIFDTEWYHVPSLLITRGSPFDVFDVTV